MQNNRLLPITSAYNFRDLGGYVTESGKHVKWNVFLRSGDFPCLSAVDTDYLTNIPIRSIVDFRAIDEIERNRDSFIPGANTHFLTVNSGNLVPQFMELMNDKETDRAIVYKKAVGLMVMMYDDIIRNCQSVYRSFFDLIQNKEVPILFHCTAGKDRTGIAAALLLSALGVEKETIYADYLLTNECLAGKYENLSEYGNLVDFFEKVRKDYLDSVFELIENEFGGMMSFLKNNLKVDIEKLRSLYLE